MPRKDMPKAPIASMPLWKALLVGLGGGLLFAFSSWLFASILHLRWGLTAWPVIHLGVTIVLFAYLWWAWRPRRKHGRWLR